MSPAKADPTYPADREIVNVRLFDAPRERLWSAFTDPKQVALWWGPNGFTNTVHHMDVRPGGRWRLTMHAANGAAFENESEFHEVVPNERIVYQHLEPIHHFQMTMLFVDRNGKTELTWRMLFESLAEAEKLRKFIHEANEQNFDRLAAHLTATR